jgi:dephospho-CoA kinase
MVKNSAMTTPTPTIGIVGGIGSGKSFVANLLKELGCVVADADANTKIVLAKKEVQEQLALWWGEKVLDHKGNVDRAYVASIVFADTTERGRLETFVHPLVRELQEKAFQNAQENTVAFVIDAPLLIEAGLNQACDAVIFVDCPFETRLQRVIKSRGWNEDQLRSREATQIGLDKKRSSADHIIINDGDIARIEQQTRSVLTLILNSTGSSE